MFNASCQGTAFFTSVAVRYTRSPDHFKIIKASTSKLIIIFKLQESARRYMKNSGINVKKVRFLFSPDISIFHFIQYLWSVQIKFLTIELFQIPHKA